MTPITMKSNPLSGPLKTKLIIKNYNNHEKKAVQIVMIIKDLQSSSDLKNWEMSKTNVNKLVKKRIKLRWYLKPRKFQKSE